MEWWWLPRAASIVRPGSKLTAAQRARLSTPAVLYLLDAATGKTLWSERHHDHVVRASRHVRRKWPNLHRHVRQQGVRVWHPDGALTLLESTMGRRARMDRSSVVERRGRVRRGAGDHRRPPRARCAHSLRRRLPRSERGCPMAPAAISRSRSARSATNLSVRRRFASRMTTAAGGGGGAWW